MALGGPGPSLSYSRRQWWSHEILRRLLRREGLGEHANLALRAMGHGQLAVMCLIARYGPAYAGADVPLVLAPTRRTPAPPADRSGCILDRYADVLGDLAR